MWRSKKFILTAVLTLAALVAILGGVAIAQADDESAGTVEDNQSTLIEKVAEIYQANTGTAIDAQALENAFVQAREEIRTEARNQFLDKLVEEGTITQEEADQWQAWLDARPDIPSLGNGDGMMRFGGMHRSGMGGGFGFRSGGGWSD
ncbi:MAG: hypothetical protein A2Z15_06945 [Chloroflexi bacterium RBG_16_50_11]|nr:MAG: hypothetical protein A2Z15_06945 [Chloroflexi bacterium RBG_16_50_11]